MLKQLSEHLTRLITQPKDELSRGQRALRYLIDLVRHCARQLAQDRAEEMAAALTYRTIFSLIPLVVLGLVVFRIFGGFEEMQTNLQLRLYDFFGVPEITYGEEPAANGAAELAANDRQVTKEEFRAGIRNAMDGLVAQVMKLNFASIGAIGVLLFIYAAMALAFSVEYDFNIIFDSPRGRPWHLRIPIYWSIITLGSGLLALSLYWSGELVRWMEDHVAYAPVLVVFSRLLALLASWVLLFLLYSLMPNTLVKLKPALVGSLIAAVLWETGKMGFQAYVRHALPYSALYGSLGLIPLFLFWIYISWLIVLFGLELACVMQVMHGKVPTKKEDEPTPRIPGDPQWFLPMLTRIGQEFQRGKTIGRQQLAEELELSSRVVNEFGSELEAAGIIHRITSDESGDARYTLARPPEAIRVTDVLELGYQLSWNHHRQGKWPYIEELHRAECEAAKNATLAELILASGRKS
jgi:membrane protein